MGKTDFDFLPARARREVPPRRRQVIESGQVLDVVEEHVTPQGEKLYVQVMKTPLFVTMASPSGSRESSGT